MVKVGPYEIRTAGVWWCRKEDYAALLRVFEDADGLPGAWEDWLKHSEEFERRLQNEGHIVERIYLDADTFAQWCAEKGKRLNSQSRIEYAAWVAGQKHRTTH